MRRRNRFLAGLCAICAGLLLAACAEAETVTKEEKSVRLEPLPGTDVKRVVLSAKAIERLDIKTYPVVDEPQLGNPAPQKVIPYSAVFYDPNGNTWTYTNPAPREFVRQPITVQRVAGDRAFLSTGPAAGTAVVVVGAAELWGIEQEVAS